MTRELLAFSISRKMHDQLKGYSVLAAEDYYC